MAGRGFAFTGKDRQRVRSQRSGGRGEAGRVGWGRGVDSEGFGAGMSGLKTAEGLLWKDWHDAPSAVEALAGSGRTNQVDEVYVQGGPEVFRLPPSRRASGDGRQSPVVAGTRTARELPRATCTRSRRWVDVQPAWKSTAVGSQGQRQLRRGGGEVVMFGRGVGRDVVITYVGT